MSKNQKPKPVVQKVDFCAHCLFSPECLAKCVMSPVRISRKKAQKMIDAAVEDFESSISQGLPIERIEEGKAIIRMAQEKLEAE